MNKIISSFSNVSGGAFGCGICSSDVSVGVDAFCVSIVLKNNK